MKKLAIVAICFLFIFITIIFSGCEEISRNTGGNPNSSKPNYINVTVELWGCFHKFVKIILHLSQ